MPKYLFYIFEESPLGLKNNIDKRRVSARKYSKKGGSQNV